MFPKNSQNIVLIGEPYKSKEEFTLYGSKIGGLPLWFTEIPSDYPYHCKVCGSEMCLLAQIYEPTDELDRVLYIFACKKPLCQLQNNAWVCIRQQKEAPEEEVVEEEKKPEPKKQATSGLSWSFGSSTPSQGLSWDFGSSTKSQSSLSSNSDLMSLLSQMENKSKKQDNKPQVNSVVKETESSASSASIPKGIKETNPNHNQFEEYYLDIFDEPEEKKPKKMNEKKYEVSMIEGENEEGENGEGGNEESEKYDDDKKMNKYLKFNSIIKQNPSQVIRIATPDGLPLYPVTIQPHPIPPCSCGSKRAFELQVLPTIQSFISNDMDISLEELRDYKEWSSVLVYTCEANCSNTHEVIEVLPPLYSCLFLTNKY